MEANGVLVPADLEARLRRVIEPDHITAWLKTRIPALDDQRPIDLIARGDSQRVSALVASLEGMPIT